MPGPDCGNRITRLHPQESTATASRYCRQFPHRPQSGPDDLAVELNPHKTELNPHKAVPAASRTRAGQNGAFLSAHGPEPIARQLATPESVVTPPVIRRARDVPLPPLVEPARA